MIAEKGIQKGILIDWILNFFCKIFFNKYSIKIIDFLIIFTCIK